MKQYLSAVRRETEYYGTWLPDKPMHLGDVGVMTRCRFERRTTLGNLGVSFKQRTGKSRASLNFASQSSVDIRVKIAGRAPVLGSFLTKADAGINIQFSRKGAVVFQLKEYTTTEIEDLDELRKAIIHLRESNRWNNNWVVVIEMISPKSATIIISRDKDAGIDLVASGKVALRRTNLADLGAKFTVLSKSKIFFDMVAHNDPTPLFGILRPFPRNVFRR